MRFVNAWMDGFYYTPSKTATSSLRRNELGVEHLEHRHLLAGVPMITEFMARNDGGLRDGDGNRSDWIEVQNIGDATLDLAGYRLTDDANQLSRWVFPSVNVEPGHYLVVFASGQNTNDYVDAGGNLHTNFRLSASGEYLALVAPDGTIVTQYGSPSSNYPEQVSNVSYGVAQQAVIIDKQSDATYWLPVSDAVDATWTDIDFDAAANGFAAGQAAMGYEGSPNSRNSFRGEFLTELPPDTHAIYARMEFQVDDAAAINRLKLSLKNDNGFIAYLNGVQVAAQNAPETVGWFASAPARTPTDSQALEFADFDLTDYVSQLVDGTNVLAIHLLNNISDRDDLLLVPRLVASINSPNAPTGYMTSPSPGAENVGGSAVFPGTVGETTIHGDPGFYDAPFTVTISSESPDAEIRYTTNGAPPTATTGSVYSGPVQIDTTTVLRAAAFNENSIPSKVVTQSYLFPEDVIRQSNDQPGYPTRWEQQAVVARYPADYEMDQDIVNDPAYRDEIVDGLKSIPTFSIVMDPQELFAPDGLYIDSGRHGRDSERAISLEIIEPGGKLGIQVDAGLRNHGNRTRDFDVTLKQSLRLVFRGEYGASKLNYPLFPDSPVDRFDNIVVHAVKILDDPQMVRNSFGRMTNIAMGHVGGYATHVHLYLNGLYWGIYNPFERPDAEFAAEYFGGSEADYDSVLTDGNEVVDGDRNRYDEMFRLIRAGTPTLEDYQELQRHVDLDSLSDILIINGYMAHDEHELQLVGSRVGDPNFRFYAHDLDEKGMGCTGRCLTTQGTVNGRSDLAGFLPAGVLAAMRENPEITLRFGDRAHKHLFNGGALTPDVARERWEGLYQNIFSAAIAETARWGDTHWRTVFEREPARRDDQLAREGTFLREQFFPQRTEILVEQLRNLDLYPAIDAPVWNQFGGAVPSGFQLTMSHPNDTGSILYTLDGTDPRVFGGDASPSALVYDGAPIEITSDTTVKSRVLADGVWSALNEANFVIASDFPLRITEINYNPHAANSAPGVTEADVDHDQFEFIELMNVGDQPVNLRGVQLRRSEVLGDTQGITFDFAAQELAAGQRVVVVRDRQSFQTRYGNSVRIAAGDDGDGGDAGEYGGRLSDTGEQLTLTDASGQLIQQFAYKTGFGWPQRANGGGSSLEIVDAASGVTDATNWRNSRDYGGSPGTAGAVDGGIAINEILANTASSDLDRIELFNGGTQDVNITNWYVSDTPADYFKSKITAPTTIAAGGYHVLQPSDFGLDLAGIPGGEVLLVSADAGGRPLQFVDHAEYGLADRGVSLGRWPTTADPFTPLETPTFGGPNSGPETSDVIISEIYFNPLDPDGDRVIQARDLEFIEVTNTSGNSVDLTGWKLAGQVGYDFPNGMALDAGQSAVIVSFDPSAGNAASKVGIFKFILGLPPTDSVLGPVIDAENRRSRDAVRDDGALVQLVRPGLPAPDDPDTIPLIVVDQVSYLPTPPWPEGTAAGGNSITRIRADAYGLSASSWVGATPSPGTAQFFDRIAGDSNEDGRFNQLDLVQVLQGGKYQTGQPASFRDGDWNGDGVFDQLDVVTALQAGHYRTSFAALRRGVNVSDAAIDTSFADTDNWFTSIGEYTVKGI